MWNIPTKKQLNIIPKLYQTKNIPLKDKVIYIHFFLFGCDWYIAETDGNDLFWGYAILNNDLEMSEWGYISFQELKDLNVNGFEVDCDLQWEPKEASKIDRIVLDKTAYI